MSFFDYFSKGFYNFIMLDAFGHALFIIVLSGVYTLNSWKGVSSYLFFFIIGFLLTFYLNWFDLFHIPYGTLKILMSVTVLVTAFTNFFVKKGVFTNRYPSQNYRFYFALIAGLIHGFSFGSSGVGNHIGNTITYNLGIVACIFILAFVFLLIALLLTYFLRVRLREWNLIISGACAGVALFKIFLHL